MTYPLSSKRITAPWNEPRPLGVADPARAHVHGAIDIGCPVGEEIRSPEMGIVYWQCQPRKRTDTHNVYWDDDSWYAFSNYFHETYGGLVIVEGKESGLTHVFAHIEAPTVFRMLNQHTSHIDCLEDDVSYLICNMSQGRAIEEGEIIGYSGNAGKSTGPHVHYEIHRRRSWLPHGERPDPAKLWNL